MHALRSVRVQGHVAPKFQQPKMFMPSTCERP